MFVLGNQIALLSNVIFTYRYFLCISLIIGTTAVSSSPGASLRSKRDTSPCSQLEFTCRNGQCISRFNVCDGRKDCVDGSDENHVTCKPANGCPKNTFKCAYGGCVDGDKKCNGVTDCADNSDELLLSCPNFIWLQGTYEKCNREQFQCRNGQCIDRYQICDGTPNCDDGSDETVTQCNRELFQCLPSNFRCAYGGCIEGSQKCDGKNHCADGSDEDDFLCNSVFKGDKGYEVVTPISPTITPPPNVTIPQGKCIVPKSIGTKYSSSECSDYDNCECYKPNAVVDSNTIVHVNCKEGFSWKTDELKFMFCHAGKWNPQNASCVRLCKPLISTSMKIECQIDGRVEDCSKGQRPKTQATFSCEQGYVPIQPDIYSVNVCLESGDWLYLPQRCIHECGILPSQALISHGVRANKTYHPWNAGIYRKLKNGTAVHICGGTLITPFSVLTAAHCAHSDKGKPVPANKFLIGLGKEYREMNHTLDADTAQHIDVKHIFISNIYDGTTVNYLADIAIYELKEKAVLSAFVMPACVDTTSKFTLTSTSVGSVVGWGLDAADGEPTETLQRADLPYIDYSECLKVLKKSQEERYLTKDKFCAFFIDPNNKTSVRSGDSGSGLTFLFEGRYYVFGLVSTQVSDYVSTFTDIRYKFNLEFINNIVQNITRRHYL